jgi:5,10-methenyltetrahydrofolate synthetase
LKIESSAHDKSALRRKFKALRQHFKGSEGEEAARSLKANLERFLRDFRDVQLCLYKAKGHEAPCDIEPADEFFYPVLMGEDLQFRKPEKGTPYLLNKLAILEPDIAKSSPLDSNKPAVVFCPAVAIDTQGMRLGMGKGFYDRYFSHHPNVLRVGVVFHVQISEQPLPAESWDQALDWIVSEKMILRTSTPTRSSQSWI